MKNQLQIKNLINMLQRRTKCSLDLFGIPAIDHKEAEEVIKIALKISGLLPFVKVNEQLENEIICQVLRSRGHEEYANVFSMVGIPVENLTDTITGNGFERHENANLQNNAETSHKKGADDLFKKFYLRLLPPKIKAMHETGDLHIHDLEYFGTRPFCIPESEIVLRRRNGKVQIATPNTCQIGDELHTNDGWNAIKFITKRSYKGDLITITTACGGMVTTTTEHRIPTVKEVKPCENLILTDELISINEDHIQGEEEISEIEALFLGSYIADGHSISRSDIGYQAIISDNSPLTARIVADFATKRGYHLGISRYPKKCTQYVISRKELCFELIDKYGLNTGASNKSLPKNIFDMPLERQRDIIAAMFYGDGSIFYQPEKSSITAYYKTVSETLMKQFGLWLTLNGIAFRIKKQPIPDNGNYPVYVIYITRDGLMKMKFLGEQKEEVEKYLSNTKQIQRKPKKNTIISIERDKFEGDVYDFGLEGADNDSSKHQFLAGTGVTVKNCFDWDLRYFLYYGLMPDGNGTKASVSGPAMHPEVAVLHAVKALGSAQTNFAGGQGYYNFLTFLAPYFRNLPYPRIKQLMQMFVFEMTQMMVARGGQLVFSSVQLSPGVPDLWKDKPVVAFGKVYDGKKSLERWVYGDLEPEVRLMFMALMDVLIKGDYWKKPFTFPKPEVVLDREFIENGALDEAFYKDGFNNHNLGIYEVARIPTYRELYQMAFRLAAETGAPYFDNCLPDYRRPGGGEGISCYQCCSYRFSTSIDADPDFRDKLVFKDGAHFSMGSWQVVTINLPRTAYNATLNQCLERIKELMKDSLQIFKAKAFWMEKMKANNRMPFITQRPHDPNCVTIKGPEAADTSRLAYTFGIVGLEECVQALIGEKMEESENAWETGLTIVSEMESYLKELERESGFTLALARTPAETVAGRFAVLDLLNEDIVFQAMDVIKGDVPGTLAKITQGGDRSLDQPVYYTNGTHMPVSSNISLGRKAEREGAFFPILSGGNIMHIFLGEEQPNPEALMNFAFKLARDTPVGYFCFTRDFTICLECSRLSGGLKEKCTYCHSTNIDHISRVTGYAQSVSGFNEAKKQELKDRIRYKM
jgi:ribonucleoside-triphosphate reductase